MGKKKIVAWIFLIIIGFSLIVWADAVCDFFKLEFGVNTIRVFIISSIIIVIGLFFGIKKIIKLIKGQLGG